MSAVGRMARRVAGLFGRDRHDEDLREELTQERLIAMVAALFGGLALLLAVVGLYGVTAYAVSRRRTELGVRLALGATPGRIIGLVLRRVALLVAIGIVAGTALSLWAGRAVRVLLHGLEPGDPATLFGAVVVLLVTAGLAGAIPAWRAARTDPASALRQ
jgi:putative ABC transport system permease protein